MTSGARLVLDRCMLFLDGGDAPGDERRTHFVKHLEVHHPRPGNAVLRSDRFGTGHRLGMQNASAGGRADPPRRQITWKFGTDF